MAIVRYREDEIPPMTPERAEALRALAEMPDSEIDCSDIPELTDEQLARMLPWDEAMKRHRERKAAKMTEEARQRQLAHQT